MHELPLHFRDGHLFAELAGDLWLLDTGAPASFGTTGALALAGESFSVGAGYMGLDTATLSELTGVRCAGLLGADVLGRFDHILDVPAGTLRLSSEELTHDGQILDLEEFMGIPIVHARLGEVECRMMFDTGAQLSYFQDDSLSGFPEAGIVTDFYPGFGQFETQTYRLPVTIGETRLTLRCGSLPTLLGLTLSMAGTQGIVGNEILATRVVGYFPGRRLLVI